MRTISIAPLVFMAACLDPYYPDAQFNPENGFLVIDGFLDGVKGTATVRLSRSLLLGELSNSTAEPGAQISVHSGGNQMPIKEKSNGLYEADNLDLDSESTYSLHVLTKDGAVYFSDPITLPVSPEFDSLFWVPQQNGIRFFVNGHDPLNKTDYWKYVFTETWEYDVPMTSKYLMSADGYPVPRRDQIHTCWNSTIATNVLVHSTKLLSTDIIEELPVNFIQKGSRMLAIRYSILVEQRSISESEYQFWDLIRRTTENVGGLFDPIPSQVTGNVHSETDPSETVLGYFAGGFPKEKRIFITQYDLPKELQVVDGRDYECTSRSVSFSTAYQSIGSDVILDLVDGVTNTYLVASSPCADCRTLGGATLKPNFWPQ